MDNSFKSPVVPQEMAAPSLLLIGALYVAQGIPLGFAFEALPVLLRSSGVPLESIAFLPLVGLPWIFKFLWAPIVDNHQIGHFGHRRGWILTMQGLLALSMLGIAVLPLGDTPVVVLMGLLVFGVVAAATQDTATDGLAAETLTGKKLAWANALQVGGMMGGFMIGGAGLLALSGWLGDRLALMIMVVSLVIALLPVLFWKEGGSSSKGQARTSRASLLGSFRRQDIWPLLLIMFCYGTLYTGGMALSKLILSDAGWSLEEVGGVAALVGGGLILLGGPAGAWVVARYGIWLALKCGLLTVGLALIPWMLIAGGKVPDSSLIVGFSAVLLGAGGGMASVATYTLIMRFAGQGEQAGTDMTLLQSVNVFAEMLVSSAAIGLASWFGYEIALAINLGCLVVVLAIIVAISRIPSLVFVTGALDDSAKPKLGDTFTDVIARRPAGWIGRGLYRHASAHRRGFELTMEAVPVGPGDHVLDLGCGGGAFLARVLDRGARAAGLDHSADMVATTCEQNAQAVEQGRLIVHRGDVTKLPFADETFSHVFCLNAFFFFPEPEAVIAEISRVLAPEGTLAILTTPPEMKSKIPWFFGPVSRRMRYDTPETMTAWTNMAGLCFRDVYPVSEGGYLHVSRKLLKAGDGLRSDVAKAHCLDAEGN